MSEPYWEPLAAVPHGIVPPATGQDGKWLKAAGGAAVWEALPTGQANGVASLDVNAKVPSTQLAWGPHYLAAQAATASQSVYPLGLSLMLVGTEPGWPVVYVTVLTVKVNDGWVFQIAAHILSGDIRMRHWLTSGTPGWSGWTPNLFSVT